MDGTWTNREDYFSYLLFNNNDNNDGLTFNLLVSFPAEISHFSQYIARMNRHKAHCLKHF